MKMMTEGVAIWKLCVWMPSKGEMGASLMKNLCFFCCIESSLFAKALCFSILNSKRIATYHAMFLFRKNPGWQRSMATSFFVSVVSSN